MPFILARRLRRARLGVVLCPPLSSKLMLLTLHLAKTHKILLTKTGEMRGGSPTYEKNKVAARTASFYAYCLPTDHITQLLGRPA